MVKRRARAQFPSKLLHTKSKIFEISRFKVGVHSILSEILRGLRKAQKKEN